MNVIMLKNTLQDLPREKRKNFLMLAVAFVTAVSGLITVMPVGMHFRFALSSIIMMFLLLFFSELPLLGTGAIVALLIFTLRVFVHYFFNLSPGFSLAEIMLDQYPSALYYLFVTIFLKLGKARSLKLKPLKLFILVVSADVGSNVLEQVLREGLGIILLLRYEVLLLVSTVRMGLIIGIIYFWTIKIYYDQERLRFEKVMLIASGLSAETFFLQKSMRDMEDTMAKSYLLYNRLKALEEKELSAMVLEVTQEVHEIKKDSARIMAGLAKLVDFENIGQMLSYNEIVELVISSNNSYAQALGKEITFEQKSETNFQIQKPYLLISVLNNLVINAVEAIPDKGLIRITQRLENGYVSLSIMDTGIGIKEEDLDLIFEPGFTTKYNTDGSASTGIGLVHVKRIIARLQGTIEFNTKSNRGTIVTIKLPLIILTEGPFDELRV